MKLKKEKRVSMCMIVMTESTCVTLNQSMSLTSRESAGEFSNTDLQTDPVAKAEGERESKNGENV